MRTREEKLAYNRAYYQANREFLIAREKERYENNREAIRAQRNAHTAAHRDEINARAREKHRLNPERKREQGRLWRERHDPRLMEHRLSPEQYAEMVADQDGACAICWAPFTVTPHIDHDHTTGHVRGLLCQRCNVALGLFRDNPDFLHRAIGYVQRAEAQPSKGEPVQPISQEAAA